MVRAVPVGPARPRGTDRNRKPGLFPAWRRSYPYQPTGTGSRIVRSRNFETGSTQYL